MYEQQLVLEFVSAHPIDAAKTLDSLPLEESGQFLKELPSTMAAQLIQQFDPLTRSTLPEYSGCSYRLCHPCRTINRDCRYADKTYGPPEKIRRAVKFT